MVQIPLSELKFPVSEARQTPNRERLLFIDL
jgi:hypothetical protein